METPDNFVAEFSKDYDINGNRFTIEVAYQGLDNEIGFIPKHVWIFRLISDGLVVTAGPFRWSISERDLSQENVANHLATFYGFGEFARLKEEARKEAKSDEQASILTTGTWRERMQYLVWMEFYESHVPRVTLEMVEVLTLVVERKGDDYVSTAIVGVDRDLEKNLYKVTWTIATTTSVRVEIYDWIRAHTFTI
jgi:hypothetical protein